MTAPQTSLLSAEERESMTADPERQDEAHVKGAYAYLSDAALTARYSVISGIVEQYDCDSLLDVGCYVGGLRGQINRARGYHGIHISSHAIQDARKTYGHYERTRFTVADVRSPDVVNEKYPCVVWAGIGFGYSDKSNQSFSDLFERTCELCDENGVLIFECIEGYAWIQDSIEKHSRLMNAIKVSYPFANIHNQRTVFISKKR